MGEGADKDIRDLLDAGRYGEALELLLDRYENKVFRLCCSMLADEALAEDTAQDIFVRVWKALPRYRGQATLSTWLYTISRNTCLTVLKREAGRRTIPLEAARQPEKAQFPSPGGLDIQALLSSLPEKHRRVLVLFYFEEKSYEEVSAMLGIPLGTVKTYLYRAKKELVAAKEAVYGVRGI